MAGDRSEARAWQHAREDRLLVEEVVASLGRDPFVPVATLARRVHLSPSHFAHRFRAAAGSPPGAFALAVRMQEAKRLIVETRLRTTDVALEVGYDSLGTFTTRFAAWVGTTPARLRRLADQPLPALAPGPTPFRRVGAAVGGRLAAGPLARGGVAFVGLFPAHLPARLPVAGTIVAVPGPYRIGGAPPGAYHVMAAAFGPGVTPGRLAASLPDAVATSDAAVAVTGDGSAAVCHLALRTVGAADPPVVVSLGVLWARAVERGAGHGPTPT